MGGLNSVLEIGMAGLAIANFYGHASTMARKFAGVIKKMLTWIFDFMGRKVFGKMVAGMSNSKTRMKVVKGVILNFVRVFSVVLLVVASKLKGEIRREEESKLTELEKEY